MRVCLERKQYAHHIGCQTKSAFDDMPLLNAHVESHRPVFVRIFSFLRKRKKERDQTVQDEKKNNAGKDSEHPPSACDV